MKMHKNMSNTEIAHLLNSVAAAYEIKDEKKNMFRIRAYQRAADAVEHLSIEAKDLWDDNELKEVGGIGENIAKYLGEIFEKGHSKHFKKVMSGIKPATFELMKISGIGPKTSHKLTKELNISSAENAIDNLEKAAQKGKISKLEGMGEDSQDSILAAIKEVKQREDRLLLSYAEKISKKIIDWMQKEDTIDSVNVLGSLRRRVSTVGDIDISVATNKPNIAVEHFVNYPNISRVIEKGEKSASILLPGDIQVDLKVGDPDTYGSLLQHFTGSKHHNIALREYAQKKNLSLSEYGIKKKKRITKTKNEEIFYKKLGMQWIPPELREAQGEIDAALHNNLPDLINIDHIKADLQIHSDFDIETSHDIGESSMKQIIKKANSLGYEYIAFTEHNPSQRNHNNNDIYTLLMRKKEVIEQLNKEYVKDSENSLKKVYNSLEVDILPNGKLPLNEKSLEVLDFALISIHSSFRQNRKKMTKRVLNALSYPKVKIFAHPTGRKINHREGVELDWDMIFEYCKKNNKWLEINADPMRLDLPDTKVKDAIENGVMLTMGTDAHNKEGLNNMKFAVDVARRGWAEKKDIINTRKLKEFEKLLFKNL
jgi:DNA polymerase (family 10)